MAVNRSSPLRVAQASQTRRRILDAAAQVFDDQGFAGSRIEDIAVAADVAVPTVYKAFSNKVNLLIGALNQVMAGDEDATVDEQTWFAEQLDQPDPDRQLELVARNARRIYDRSGHLLAVLRGAAPLDPELQAAWNEVSSQRFERSRRTAKSLATKAGDRLLLSRDETAVTLWALTEPMLFTTYTASKRTSEQYETWLGRLLRRSLLD